MNVQENKVEEVVKNGRVVMMTFRPRCSPIMLCTASSLQTATFYRSDAHYPERLMRSLYRQTTDNMKWLCDVVVKVEGVEFLAHGFILRFFSGYFERRIEKFGRFTTFDFDEELSAELDHRAVGQIIKFMYTGKVEVTSVVDTMRLQKVASFLEIPCLAALAPGRLPDDSLAQPFLINLREAEERRRTCDVTLLADGKKFHAHRSILAAACPYFAGMFRNGTIECHQPQVELPFLAAEEASNILTYFYNGVIYLQDDNEPPW
ncbi:uncharacterized protein LOC144451357 [Glandiceps talaboti]